MGDNDRSTKTVQTGSGCLRRNYISPNFHNVVSQVQNYTKHRVQKLSAAEFHTVDVSFQINLQHRLW